MRPRCSDWSTDPPDGQAAHWPTSDPLLARSAHSAPSRRTRSISATPTRRPTPSHWTDTTEGAGSRPRGADGIGLVGPVRPVVNLRVLGGDRDHTRRDGPAEIESGARV